MFKVTQLVRKSDLRTCILGGLYTILSFLLSQLLRGARHFIAFFKDFNPHNNQVSGYYYCPYFANKETIAEINILKVTLLKLAGLGFEPWGRLTPTLTLSRCRYVATAQLGPKQAAATHDLHVSLAYGQPLSYLLAIHSPHNSTVIFIK